jgi:hypothetical protein
LRWQALTLPSEAVFLPPEALTFGVRDVVVSECGGKIPADGG